MKILHWKDRYGNEGHGEPIDDDLCDTWVQHLNAEYLDEIGHWAEAVHETDEEQ